MAREGKSCYNGVTEILIPERSRKMKVISQNPIYENPLPQLRSRQAFFPWLCEKKDGELLASFAIGEIGRASCRERV